MKAAGASSVMAARQSPRGKPKPAKAKAGKAKPAAPARPADPRDGLDFFPTPPWATRALLRHVLPMLTFPPGDQLAWDPCCGEGHMAEVLRESFRQVHASDVYPHGYGEVGSFVGQGGLDLDVAHCPFRPDWIIMNPPFNLSLEFAERAIDEAAAGVAILVRTTWIESAERYGLFCRHQPSLQATFAERVPMVEHRWDPEASSATSYSWMIWTRAAAMPVMPGCLPTWRTVIIPPGCREALTKPGDIARWTDTTPIRDMFGDAR